MIKVTSTKISSFVKSKQGFRLDIYYELDQKFNDIALKLDRNEIFHDE